MFCQVCGAKNPDEQEYCFRCQQKLLVLSGTAEGEEGQREFAEESADEGYSFDEHLLERISVLEEAVKRTTETVRHLLVAVGKQERSILINQTGLATLREILEEKRVIARDEWSELWEIRMETRMLALEKRERFLAVKQKILALHPGNKEQLFRELLDDAEYALYAFDVDRAIGALEAAYRIGPDNYELNYFIGETHFNLGRPELALPFFSRVLDSKPDHYEGLVYSGVIHHERGSSERATALLQRAVALFPDSFLAQFSLGAVYAGQGNLERASALLERAVEIDPVPQALFLLASSLYEMGKLSGAIKYLQQVVRHDPAHEEAYHLLGLAYLDRRWNRKALEAFREAQRLNPRKLRYQDLVKYLSGQTSSPLPEVSTAARDWLAKAEELRQANHPVRALEYHRKAIEEDADNPTLLMTYAMACLELDRSSEAERVTRRILDLEPNEMLGATACAALIEALRSDGRYREGNRIGKELLEGGGADFSRSIAYYEMACNLAEMEEELDLALEYARTSLELTSDELRQFPLAALGWVHYKRKEFDQAVEFLHRSSELGSSYTTLNRLGMALLASGDEDRARAVLADARVLEGEGASVERAMMDYLQTSSRLLARVQHGAVKR